MDEEQWYAVYTSCRHEKQVARHFEHRMIESFLPLYRAQHRWKDGSNPPLELPLFPGYIFVRIGCKDRVRVLEVPGVLSLVGKTASQPTPLPQLEIESLRAGLDPDRVEPHPLLSLGQRVRIRAGALAGMEGRVVRKKNSLRVVITLALLMQSISVEVDANDLELLEPSLPLAATTFQRDTPPLQRVSLFGFQCLDSQIDSPLLQSSIQSWS
jgi:transcription antitermination factor NusG